VSPQAHLPSRSGKGLAALCNPAYFRSCNNPSSLRAIRLRVASLSGHTMPFGKTKRLANARSSGAKAPGGLVSVLSVAEGIEANAERAELEGGNTLVYLRWDIVDGGG